MDPSVQEINIGTHHQVILPTSCLKLFIADIVKTISLTRQSQLFQSDQGKMTYKYLQFE